MDPAVIERLRENSHIRLDREGRFWHEGALVEHPRVALAFHKGLGRAPDGRPTISFGRTWCYIVAEGPLFQVRAALCTPAADDSLRSCLLRLDDGSEEALSLSPGAVAADGEGVLHVRVKGGREWARLAPAAQAELGRWAAAGADGRFGLQTSEGLLTVETRTF